MELAEANLIEDNLTNHNFTKDKIINGLSYLNIKYIGSGMRKWAGEIIYEGLTNFEQTIENKGLKTKISAVFHENNFICGKIIVNDIEINIIVPTESLFDSPLTTEKTNTMLRLANIHNNPTIYITKSGHVCRKNYTYFWTLVKNDERFISFITDETFLDIIKSAIEDNSIIKCQQLLADSIISEERIISYIKMCSTNVVIGYNIELYILIFNMFNEILMNYNDIDADKNIKKMAKCMCGMYRISMCPSMKIHDHDITKYIYYNMCLKNCNK